LNFPKTFRFPSSFAQKFPSHFLFKNFVLKVLHQKEGGGGSISPVAPPINRRNSMWSANKVRELIAVKVLHSSLLNTTMVAFKVLPSGSYARMPAPSPPFKTILELVLWNVLQSCRCITPHVINVIKMPSFQYFLYLGEHEKNHWGLDPVNRQGVPTEFCLLLAVLISLRQ